MMTPKMKSKHLMMLSLIVAGLTSAVCQDEKPRDSGGGSTFGQDVAFLQQHTDAIVLRRGDAAIVVVPQFQGRVMTATARGDDGPSSGWINYDVVKQGVLPEEKAKGKLEEHMYAFGGEERFWMGPEGGQYSIFFAPGTSFDFANWFTPDPIDNEPWEVVRQDAGSAEFARQFELRNHSGTPFRVGVERKVSLLGGEELGRVLKGDPPEGIDVVAYRTENTVTNRGEKAWQPDTGLVSIWLLCMLQPSPTTTVFIPYREGDEEKLGPVVNADYFGRVPPDRLQAEAGVIYFKADGKARGKIGLTPQRSLGLAGSYDPALPRMTLLLADRPGENARYVNSMWELQDQPYQGDALNSYNDGPVDASGEQMGPFYELESSSPALALKPGESATHRQTLVHLYGEQAKLQEVLSRLAEVDLSAVKAR